MINLDQTTTPNYSPQQDSFQQQICRSHGGSITSLNNTNRHSNFSQQQRAHYFTNQTRTVIFITTMTMTPVMIF